MIRVAELFAGVGGFRIGLEGASDAFKTIWNNQWEPSTKTQDAFNCYGTRFGFDDASNTDIFEVDKKTIPNHTLLVGGFPCQDYSVASSLSTSKGLEGKKGVLWWDIRDILETKSPSFVILENVDRLLKSPAKQRGRDFGIILACLARLNYSVEWRVINAAEYGFPQKRRRVFIFAYNKSTNYFKKMDKVAYEDLIYKEGIFAKNFPIKFNSEQKSLDGENLSSDEFDHTKIIKRKFKDYFGWRRDRSG